MTAERAIVVVGEALLDRDTRGRVSRVCPDAPAPVVDVDEELWRAGGAGLAATLVARSARTVLVTPIADDASGHIVRSLLGRAGVEVIGVPSTGATPEKHRVRVGDHQVCRLDRGGRCGDVTPLSEEIVRVVAEARAVLVADYGRGLTGEPVVRTALARRRSAARMVWDPHPNGAAPVRGSTIVTPNLDELRARSGREFVGPWSTGSFDEVRRAAEWLQRDWGALGVAVTLGADGALLVGHDSAPLVVPTHRRRAGDTCGAGDAFAAAAVLALANGAVASDAVTGAVGAAEEFVAAGAAAGLACGSHPRSDRAGEDGVDLHAGGRRIVATSGCFDLLHVGHLRFLRQARALGDRLIVCLNSDDSVRGLKGAGRPLVPVEERRDLLLALDCVDEVIVFDDPTPVALLDRLGVDVFAKGGDYRAVDLPESEVVIRRGGVVVTLPYLDGHSTSRFLVDAAAIARESVGDRDGGRGT